MSVKVSIGAEFIGTKAFKQADTAVSKLNKSVNALGKTLGISLGTAAIVAFGKASVRAFIADEKAASVLANTMKNLGLQMSAPSVEAYIQSLERATGVVDDQLRPAMQTLLQVTGSVANSQKILAQAIEVSRATGIELTTVAQDLGQAYVGNTRGLRKYSLGLTQAELKAASFADIQKRINTLFGGANEAYLTTYAGQMERLGVAAGEAKETIGKGLVDALVTLSGSKGVDELALKLERVAQVTSNIIGSISRFIAVTGGILSGKNGEQIRKEVFGKPKAINNVTPSISAMVQAAEQKKAEAAAVKRQKELVALQKKQLSATKSITQAKKASAIFDIDQIQIVAALKGKLTEEEKIRLQLQSAILMGNNDEAKRLTIELSKTVGMSQELSTWLRNLPDAKNPFEAWKAFLDGILGQMQTISMGASVGSTHVGGTGLADWGAAAYEAITNPYGTGSYYGATGRDMPSNLNIVVTGGDAITQQLRFDLIGSSASGSASSLNRTTSSF